MGKTLRRLIGAVAAGVLAASTLTPAGPATAAGPATILRTTGPYWLIFGHSGKCIDVPNSNPDNVRVTQYTCVPGAWNQQWLFDWHDDDWFQARNRATGKCLNVSGNDTTAGTPIIVFPCAAPYENEWFTQDYTFINGQPMPPGAYTWIKPWIAQNMAVHQSGNSQANNAFVSLWPAGTARNTWINATGAR